MLSPRTSRSDPRRAGDAGFTLPEVLICVVLIGVLMSAVTAATSTFLRSEKPTQARLSESKDITFLQTWLPLDLASAISSDRDPLAQPAPGETLPGTNVLTLVRPDVTGSTTVYYRVSYRYVHVGNEWRLVRYEIRDPGLPSQTVAMVGVAHELSAPPPEWTPDQAPTFAIEVTARNQVIIRPIGEDVLVTFTSGQQFSTGGAGMSSEDQLPTDYSGGFTDPSAPPSRCGGTITLVLDTSTSIPNQNGESAVMTSANGFIDAFAGTPTLLSVVGFDEKAYSMFPTTAGTFVNLLNNPTAIASMKAKINQLQDLPGQWSWSNKDPGHDGFYWGFGWSGSGGPGGTNWEDGLYLPFRTSAGVPHAQLPDLVVFITDGQPNRKRSGSVSTSVAVTAAQASANYGRGTGGRIVGILVGSEATASKSNLKAVVGNNEWNGTGPDAPGNAGAADIFMPGNNGDFDELGDTLRAIMVAQCGGTVTVQKRLDDGAGNLSEPVTPWSYTTDIGVRELNPATESSITFDYTFPTGTPNKTVQITEAPQEGWTYDRAVCTVGGVPVDGARVVAPPDGSPGVQLEIRPDQAMSCTLISVPS